MYTTSSSPESSRGSAVLSHRLVWTSCYPNFVLCPPLFSFSSVSRFSFTFFRVNNTLRRTYIFGHFTSPLIAGLSKYLRRQTTRLHFGPFNSFPRAFKARAFKLREITSRGLFRHRSHHLLFFFSRHRTSRLFPHM